jgi:predicted hydrocarbon binding protein
MPRAQVLDQPGFIVFKMGGKSKIYSRQILFPESFLVDLESELINKFGDSARSSLYKAGKKFGHVFASMGNFFTYKNFSENNKLIEYIGLLNNFIEGTYAKKMSFVSDLSLLKFDFTLDNFISCNKSGQGYFLPTGAAAGLLCYLFERDDIEGVQIKCQGKGEKACLVTYAPEDYFKKSNISFLPANPFEKIKVQSDYANWNRIQPTKYSKKSFQMLLNAKHFTYDQGVIQKESQRYFIFEASGVYILENELKSNPDFLSVLSEVSIKQGKLLWEIGAKDTSALCDLLTSFGWGDVFIIKKSNKFLVNIDYYPWTSLFDKSEFTIIQGILKGALSKIDGRDIAFNSSKKSFVSGSMSISFTE